MAADIGQELYEKIKKSFDEGCTSHEHMQNLIKKIKSGKADMIDINSYSRSLGYVLSRAIQKNVTPDVLPDGKLYYNIAEKILEPTLHNNYELIYEAAAIVQEELDRKLGIKIRPQKAPYPKERVDAIINAASQEGVPWETTQRRLSSPVETISQSFSDDYMETNAKFRTRAGFKEYIVRKDDGNCCEWCAKLAGKYLYPESTPHDVFRRHDNCGCTVTYEDGEMRTRQQVWSKRDWSDEEEQKYLEASDKHKRTMAAMKEDLRLYREGKLSPRDANISYQENRRALANIRNLRDRTPVKFTPAQAEALENLALANSARAKNPVDISAESGIMGERDHFNTKNDPMREIFGSAELSNPKDIKALEAHLKNIGVQLERPLEERLSYEPSPTPGTPGKAIISQGASYSAWLHEVKHADDDMADGWLGMRVFSNPQKCAQREIDAYEIEINIAKKSGKTDIVKRLEALRDDEIKKYGY